MIFSTFLIDKKLHSPGIRRVKVERQMATGCLLNESHLHSPFWRVDPAALIALGRAQGCVHVLVVLPPLNKPALAAEQSAGASKLRRATWQAACVPALYLSPIRVN